MPTEQNQPQVWRILIVDDNLQFADDLARSLVAIGNCTTRAVANLRSARIEFLSPSHRPHIMILDFNLPIDKDWEPLPNTVLKPGQKYDLTRQSLYFCKEITSNPKYRDILVIMVSLEDQRGYVDLASQAGAHSFFFKDDLLKHTGLKKMLELAKARLPRP
jgi:CheY-like chemotaxis protein